MYFAIDPAQSVVTATATIEIPQINLTVVTHGQGTQGLGVPGFSDGTQGMFAGLMAADVDTSAGTITFGGGSMYGESSGTWEPLPLGATGTAPAFLGVRIDGVLGIPATAVAAVRDFWADYFSAYQITNLNPTGANQYQFTADQWLSISTNIDVQGQSGIGATLGSQRYDLSERYAAQNGGQTGSLTQLAGGNWQVRVPIDTSVFISAGSSDLGPIYVDLQVQGQMVGNSIPTPSPGPVLESIAGNTSLALAQSINGAFNRNFDPNVGNDILNTSAIMPHATIHGAFDGNLHYFSFTVGQAAAIGIFDIDNATFDSQLFLYDAAGHLLASDDDASSTYGGHGSSTSRDAYLQYTFAQPGTYTIAVGYYTPPTNGPLGPAAVGGEYTLQVSIAPEPPAFALAALPLVGFLFAARRRLGRRTAAVFALMVLAAFAPHAVLADDPLVKNSLEEVYDPNGQYPMPYRLFVPPQSASEPEEKFPLVLFLHGSGERGIDNYAQVSNHIDGLIQATQSDAYASFLLAPQLTDYPYAGSFGADDPFDRTMDILQQVMAEYPIDPSRIYITGLSLGGFGTFTYMDEFPSLWAAAVPLSGGGDPSTASVIKDIPTWAFHGSADATVPVTDTINMINAMTAAGGSPLFTEIPGGGHDIWEQVYGDAQTQEFGLYDWLFAQHNTNTPWVPEPGTWGMAATAALGFGIAAWRRRGGRFVA